ncbi:MAG: PAS domain-containing sensor histidine kinase, partial [Halobacteriales archaeon]
DVTERKERERALRRYERVVNTMPAGAAIYDEAGRFELVNEYLANTYETSRSALIGEKGRLVPQVRRQGDGDRFQALLDGARDEARGEVEIEFAHKENEVVDYRLAPFRTDGEIDGVVAVAYDISERKARERELETLRDRMEFVFEVTDSHVWTAEFESGATETYGDTEPLYGRPAEDVQRTEVFYELVHPDDRPRLRRAFEAVADGDRDTFEVEYRTNPAQGEVRWLHSQARLREESDARRLVGLTTDVTERKRHERRLTRQKDRLEEFTSVVSHDLRNPLSVAKGRVELARETGETEQLEPARHALERSQSLIDDLLTLARSGEELGTTEPVELGAVVEECWRTVESPNATLVADTDRTVRADRSRLRQLLENLLRNAVDHSEAAVTVTVGDADDGFYVADDGPGIPADERERVFEPGYTTTDRGTGLGLAIVNRIVAAHDWEIAVTESAAGGARFDVTGVEVADT